MRISSIVNTKCSGGECSSSQTTATVHRTHSWVAHDILPNKKQIHLSCLRDLSIKWWSLRSAVAGSFVFCFNFFCTFFFCRFDWSWELQFGVDGSGHRPSLLDSIVKSKPIFFFLRFFYLWLRVECVLWCMSTSPWYESTKVSHFDLIGCRSRRTKLKITSIYIEYSMRLKDAHIFRSSIWIPASASSAQLQSKGKRQLQAKGKTCTA